MSNMRVERLAVVYRIGLGLAGIVRYYNACTLEYALEHYESLVLILDRHQIWASSA